jgi:hypothetical protein
MSLPTTLGAYRECQEVFENAARDSAGARVQVADYNAAVGLRTRLHYFRKLDRAANAQTYPADHPQHGQSIYDDFSVSIYPDEDRVRYWLYIEPRSKKILAIEGLSETPPLIADNITDGEASETFQIEDQSRGQ